MIGSLDESFFNETNLVNFANSILKNYGIETFHSTIKEIDDVLKNHKKICLFLFDGMGEYIQTINKHSVPFISSGKYCNIFSTNPATTVAATNAIRSGKYPSETGWFGWVEHSSKTNESFTSFGFNDIFSKQIIKDHKSIEKLLQYKTITAILSENGINAGQILGKVQSDSLESSKSISLKADSLSSFKNQANVFFNEMNGQFLYAYWPNPDHLIHDYGTRSFRVKISMFLIDRLVKDFVKKHPDVLTIVLADHGLIDIDYDDISTDLNLMNCLEEKSPILLEGRTASFLVKKGMEKQFEKAFSAHFDDTCVLLTTNEAIQLGYFGKTKNKSADKFTLIGNYVAIMKNNNLNLYNSNYDTPHHKAHHAGGTLEERLIRISIFNK